MERKLELGNSKLTYNETINDTMNDITMNVKK